MAKRVIWIVLDSAGIGEEPDADKFGDVGSDTFGHILETYPDAKFDNLTKLGLRARVSDMMQFVNVHIQFWKYRYVWNLEVLDVL